MTDKEKHDEPITEQPSDGAPVESQAEATDQPNTPEVAPAPSPPTIGYEPPPAAPHIPQPPPAPAFTPDPATAAAPEPSRSPLSYKNPTLAAAFSIFPGLGHIYNGLYIRGLTFIVTFVALIGMASHGADIMAVGVGFFWFFNLFDAYRQATLINYGYATDLGVTDRPRRAKPGSSGLALGVILFIVGLYGVLERYLRIDLDWVLNLWPFGLMAIGAWIIWSALSQRKDGSQKDTSLGEDYL